MLAAAMAMAAATVLLPGGARADAGSDGEADGRLSVFVSILPQSWFVERIGGNDVEVFFLVGPGDSPATFEPAPRELVRLAGADLLLTIGVPFEKMLMPRLEGRHEGLAIRDMAEGVERRRMEPAAGGRHARDNGHPHGPTDPHVWLDPVRAETPSPSYARLTGSASMPTSTG